MSPLSGPRLSQGGYANFHTGVADSINMQLTQVCLADRYLYGPLGQKRTKGWLNAAAFHTLVKLAPHFKLKIRVCPKALAQLYSAGFGKSFVYY